MSHEPCPSRIWNREKVLLNQSWGRFVAYCSMPHVMETLGLYDVVAVLDARGMLDRVWNRAGYFVI